MLLCFLLFLVLTNLTMLRFLSFSYHSVLWMDHLFNLLQLPQHWPHPHPHHQQTLQGWLHSHRCVHQELCHTVMNREGERCQSVLFKALTQSAEYFMMSRLLSVIISIESEQRAANQHQIEFLSINDTERNL